MTAKTKTSVKSFFETGDKPTEAQFEHLIDSYQDSFSVLQAIGSAADTKTGLIQIISPNEVSGVPLGAFGSRFLSVAGTASAQSQFGMGAVGSQLISVATTVSAQRAIGITTVGSQLISVASTAAAGGLILPAGSVVQEVVATSTTDDTTTALTMQNSSLVGTITPQFSDSVIEVTAIIPVAGAGAVAGTPSTRQYALEIRNETNAVSSPEFRYGRNLVTGSSVAAINRDAAHLTWRYTVNSLTARTFRVRFRSLEATNVQADILGATSTATMILREIKQ